MTDPGYARLAAEHLPADLAQRFTALLRPCLRLRRAADGEPTAVTLGGQPQLPDGVDWPEEPGHGRLSFVASVHCAALPPEAVAPGFPRDGTLLFFCAEFQAASRVIYVPEDTSFQRTDSPRVCLAAHVQASAPDLWLPQPRLALLGDGGVWPQNQRDVPAELRAFHRAFRRRRASIGHQLFGHAVPVQGPVEYEIADAVLGGGRAWGDDVLDREAERWRLLAQFDGDGEAKPTWGGDGAVYWLIRADDLPARRFDRARAVVQS
jgi:hypothetical protein